MNLIERVKAPLPKFFRIVRAIGLVLVAAGGAILASPVALPAIIASAGGYMVVAGTVMTTISQATVDESNNEGKKKMSNRNLTIETATGTAGGSMLSILANITLGDITKTIIMAIVGTVVSFFVSLLLKKFLNGKRRP